MVGSVERIASVLVTFNVLITTSGDRQIRLERELKPDNPRQIRNGQRQLQDYLDELNGVYKDGPRWTGSVVTYGGQ